MPDSRASSKPPATSGWRSAVRLGLYAAMAALIGTTLYRSALNGPPEGSVAAGFELQSLSPDASPLSLDSLKGRPILIEVFASWCASCRSAAPAMSRLFRSDSGKKAHFVDVSVDESLEQARAVVSAWQIPFPVGLDDGSFSRSYRIQSLPTFVLIDRAGRVRRVSTGITSEARLRSWLDES